MRNKDNKGFTLVELLVVVAIMSILTVITVSQFMTARAKARDVARKGDINAVSKALLMYFNDYGEFPDALNGEIEVGGTPKHWGQEFSDNAVNAYSYMKVLPVENTTGHLPYCYAVSLDKKKFALFAALESSMDSECSGNYTCNGRGSYCYITVSPNSTKGEW